MRTLSIFVDESGDFGAYSPHSPYYIIAMIFHEQDKGISTSIAHLDNALRNRGYDEDFVIHTEPLIRREESCKFMPPTERRAIISALFYTPSFPRNFRSMMCGRSLPKTINCFRRRT